MILKIIYEYCSYWKFTATGKSSWDIAFHVNVIIIERITNIIVRLFANPIRLFTKHGYYNIFVAAISRFIFYVNFSYRNNTIIYTYLCILYLYIYDYIHISIWSKDSHVIIVNEHLLKSFVAKWISNIFVDVNKFTTKVDRYVHLKSQTIRTFFHLIDKLNNFRLHNCQFDTFIRRLYFKVI